MEAQLLYKVPRGTWVVTAAEENPTPIAAAEIQQHEILYFHHTDGMYSLCQDVDGNIKHLYATAKVVDINHLATWKPGMPDVRPGKFRGE